MRLRIRAVAAFTLGIALAAAGCAGGPQERPASAFALTGLGCGAVAGLG
jgi:hypothetical protein